MFTYNFNFNFFLDNGQNDLHVYVFNWSENLDSGAFWYAEQVYLGTIYILKLKNYMFTYNWRFAFKNTVILNNGRNNLHVYVFNWSGNLDSGAFRHAEQVYLGTIRMLRLKYYMFKYNFKIFIKKW